MHFGQPQILWLLALALPAAVFLYWRGDRQRRGLLEQFVHPRLLAGLLAGFSPGRRKLRRALFVASVALVLLALGPAALGL